MKLTDGQIVLSILALSYFIGLFIACMVANMSDNKAKKRAIKRNIHRQGRALKMALRGF
jgi:ParB-like chromosome segregation protein Spo0J